VQLRARMKGGEIGLVGSVHQWASGSWISFSTPVRVRIIRATILRLRRPGELIYRLLIAQHEVAYA
jgi:hypothetical protein